MFFFLPMYKEGPQNFWNCYKNLFKLFVQEPPSKYSPCDWKQQSQCCSLCCKHCLKSLTEMLSRAASGSHWPVQHQQNTSVSIPASSMGKYKSQSENGRVGGWDTMTILLLARNCSTLKAVGARALSWCRNQFPLCHFSGCFHRKLSCNCFSTFN